MNYRNYAIAVRHFCTSTMVAGALATMATGCDRVDPDLLAQLTKSDKGQPAGDERPTPPPPPTGVGDAATVHMDCASDSGYEVTGFSNAPETIATSKNPEVHVLGVYETRSDHNFNYHPMGKAIVHFERTAPSVLVLTSYEPTAWQVQVAPDAQLQKIVVSGYSEQTVNVSGKVQTEIHTVIAGDEAPYAYQYPSDEAAGVLRFAAERGGAKPLSFHGCYRATTFSVR